MHGVYHGPECWDEALQLLRARGHECRAVALRGHGPEDRRDFDFRGVRFADYVADVRRELTEAGPDTILVGHSLGGMIARRLIETEDVAGAVMVCTPTPPGLRRATWRLLRHFPLATLKFMSTLRSECLYHDPSIAPLLFWSRSLDELPEPAWFQRVLEFRESRRLFLDVMALRFRAQRAGTRVLVVAGSEDFTISLDSQRKLAALHAARLETVDGAPHDVMLTHPAALAAILDEFAGVPTSSSCTRTRGGSRACLPIMPIRSTSFSSPGPSSKASRS